MRRKQFISFPLAPFPCARKTTALARREVFHLFKGAVETPKPEGWTDQQLKHRDAIAKALMVKKRLKASNAYRLATWVVEHRKEK